MVPWVIYVAVCVLFRARTSKRFPPLGDNKGCRNTFNQSFLSYVFTIVGNRVVAAQRQRQNTSVQASRIELPGLCTCCSRLYFVLFSQPASRCRLGAPTKGRYKIKQVHVLWVIFAKIQSLISPLVGHNVGNGAAKKLRNVQEFDFQKLNEKTQKPKIFQSLYKSREPQTVGGNLLNTP